MYTPDQTISEDNYTIGTCSLCGGPVKIARVYMSVIPPTPTCVQCGAVSAAPHGPVIPMRPAAPVLTFVRVDTTETTCNEG